MAVTKLGVFGHVQKLGERDASHVPHVLASCDSSLKAGDNVRFTHDFTKVVKCKYEERQGIVDPYLPEIIPANKCVQIMLIPSMISNFTHTFDITGEPKKVTILEQDWESEKEYRRKWEAETQQDYWECRNCY